MRRCVYSCDGEKCGKRTVVRTKAGKMNGKGTTWQNSFEGIEGLLESFEVEEMVGSNVQLRKITLEGLYHGGAKEKQQGG